MHAMTTVLRWLTRVTLAIAALCLALVAFTLAEQSYYRNAARTLSAAVRANAIHQPAVVESPVAAPIPAEPDLEIVSPAASSVLKAAPGLLGELDVPQLRIATAIVEGDDSTALRRGAGHVRGSAL